MTRALLESVEAPQSLHEPILTCSLYGITITIDYGMIPAISRMIMCCYPSPLSLGHDQIEVLCTYKWEGL